MDDKIKLKERIVIIKPFLKWVGGKTQILDSLMTEFPTNINNYREIFLGGGSVLLALLSYVKHGIININGNIYAYDINEALISIYKNIQSNHEELYEAIQKLIIEFRSYDMKSKEKYYYQIREEYNKLNDKNTIIGSAMFIFLNKTCFRGVYRIGPKGFNVPYGNYKNPEIITKKHLDDINELIQDVIFECCDYNKSLKNVEYGDYIYLDPPYVSETKTSFVGYTRNGFNIENNKQLFSIIHKLTNENKKCMLSNLDIGFVCDNFVDKRYKITSITCKRLINSKNPRAKINEVIIKNY